jgi:hypothetical protein
MIMLILDLPAEFGVSTSFNVADLKPYRVKMRICHRGRLQFKKGRTMRTPHVHLHKQQLWHLQMPRRHLQKLTHHFQMFNYDIRHQLGQLLGL